VWPGRRGRVDRHMAARLRSVTSQLVHVRRIGMMTTPRHGSAGPGRQLSGKGAKVRPSTANSVSAHCIIGGPFQCPSK
jgi:hypothetical protein